MFPNRKSKLPGRTVGKRDTSQSELYNTKLLQIILLKCPMIGLWINLGGKNGLRGRLLLSDPRVIRYFKIFSWVSPLPGSWIHILVTYLKHGNIYKSNFKSCIFTIEHGKLIRCSCHHKLVMSAPTINIHQSLGFPSDSTLGVLLSL